MNESRNMQLFVRLSLQTSWKKTVSVQKLTNLVGGFKYFIFSPRKLGK